ncbi:hypothetical protein INT47_006106, partial [Mucor saturninus]
IQTFDDMYEAGANIASNQQAAEQTTVPLQYGFQILIGCLMMFCLIVDLIILTTVVENNSSRLVLAPRDLLFSNETFFQNCQQKLTGTHTSLVLISEVCLMQSRLNHIVTLSIIFRDILICGVYVAVSYVYVLRLVETLKRRTSSDTAMHVMANSYHYPITQ